MTVGIGEEREGEPEIGNLRRWGDGLASELLGPFQERCQVVGLDVERDPTLSAVLAGADPAGDSFLARSGRPVAGTVPASSMLQSKSLA